MRRFQQLVCGIVLAVLYRAIRVLARADSRVGAELRSLPEGQIVRFSVSPDPKSPSLTFQVTGGTIRREKNTVTPHVHIVFKNEDMAFRVFTGRMGIAGAYAAHAFTLRGNINETMGIVRIVDLVEGYLFPRFLTRHILKEAPKKELPSLVVYLRLIPGV
jgi:hypothetical protein